MKKSRSNATNLRVRMLNDTENSAYDRAVTHARAGTKPKTAKNHAKGRTRGPKK